jgi:hemin uptake protein HemP
MRPEVSPTPASDDTLLNGRAIPSERLFAGRREIVILHNGREYRLRLTQAGKLILTA